VSAAYAGRQFVGVDLHRRRSVIVRMAESGERMKTVRILNDPERLAEVITTIARRIRTGSFEVRVIRCSFAALVHGQ
jgi:hypothetical protein